MTITVMCVDDHPLIREGIAALIAESADVQLVAEASGGAEAIDKFRLCKPDVTLMDLQMPVMSGIETMARIRDEHRNARIVVLTTYGGDVIAQRAIKQGAVAYLLKSDVRKDLLDTIRDVHLGLTRIDSSVAVSIATQSFKDPLSSREIGVLEHIAAGRTNKEIGDRLFITEGTVKNHVKSILSKLHASDRTHAVMVALSRGIIGL